MTGADLDPEELDAVPSEEDPEGEVESMFQGKLVGVLVLAILAVAIPLLVAVVVVGLLRDNLDTTGVATVLSTLISGIVLGSFLRKKDPPS